MNRTRRYNVVSLGARDYYQVAMALNDAGYLNRLITDFYTPDILRGRLGKRFDPDLPSRRTLSLLFTLILTASVRRLLGRIGAAGSAQLYVDYLFGFLAAAVTYWGGNGAIVYSYYLEGFVGFYRLTRTRCPELICFQVHPAPWYVQSLIERDTAAFAKEADVNFQREQEENYTPNSMQRYLRALSYCDWVICASSATLRSLAHDPRIQKKASVVPYGSKFEGATNNEFKDRLDEPLVKLLTVCQLTQRKGMHWAFLAMSRLPENVQSKFSWTIVSSIRDPAIEAMAPKCVNFLSGQPDEKIRKLMGAADLYAMPSIIEGFGLVYVEAMSVGTPIMFTQESGPADFSGDVRFGFQVPCSDWVSIQKVFEQLSFDKSQLLGMRSSVQGVVKTLTWSAFRKGIIEVVERNRSGHIALD